MLKHSRVLLLLCLILFDLSLFPVIFPDFKYSSIISYLLIFLMALPSYHVLVRWLGGRKGGVTLLVLSVLPLIIEAFAVSTGFPYGRFVYSEVLGFKLFGLVPVSVSFAYLPMLLGAVTIAGRISSDLVYRSLLGGVISVIIDLVIDPATVAGGMWIWEGGGTFYGVPISNFVGWLFTGTIYSFIFFWINRNPTHIPVELLSSLLLILSFWSGFLLWKELILPMLIGVAFFVYIVKFVE